MAGVSHHASQSGHRPAVSDTIVALERALERRSRFESNDLQLNSIGFRAGSALLETHLRRRSRRGGAASNYLRLC